MNKDVRAELESAGRRDVPSPRPGFTADLEQRLLTVARNGGVGGSPSPDGSRPRPRRGPALGVATGLVTVFVLFAVIVGVGQLGPRSSGSYELTDAVNVEVALADGTTLVNPVGLVLPDAAIVTIGPGGFARIGDVSLGAGDVATVDGSELRIDRSDRSGYGGASGSARATAVPTRSPRSASPPTATPTAPPTTGRPDATPAQTAAPTTTSSEPPPPTVRPRTPQPTDRVEPLNLVARRSGPSEVGARWTGTAGARRYILRASASKDGPAVDPVHPGSPIIGTFTHPPSDPLIFRVGRDVVELRLLVVALDGDGVEISRSNIAVVTFAR